MIIITGFVIQKGDAFASPFCIACVRGFKLQASAPYFRFMGRVKKYNYQQTIIFLEALLKKPLCLHR